MRKLILAALGVLAPMAFGSALTDFKSTELPGERFEVKLTFDELNVEPAGYTIEKPARIVFDFPGVTSALKDKKYPLSGAGQSAMIMATDDRTRVILNLSDLTTYSTKKVGNSYVIEVGGLAQSQPLVATDNKKSSSASSKEKSNRVFTSAKASIENIDFRRGESGEGRILIKLSDPHVNASLVSTGGGVKLTFSNMTVPESLRKRLDVVDFATPVTLLATSQDSSDVTINVNAKGDFDYLAYQTDNEYVLSVKPLSAQAIEEKKREFQFTGDKLSFNFQDIEVRAVLQIIADFTELNLVASDTVNGRITLRLDNVPWDQALALVLKTKGLDKRQEGNVLMIAPASEIAERERQELNTKKQLEELAPLRTEYMRVRYASAKSMYEVFRGGRGGSGGNRATASMLSERGSAIVDDRTNSIILTDTGDRIEAVKRLIEQIDIPVKQVMIEARIVIANTDYSRQLGIKWGGIAYSLNKNSLTQVGGSLDSLTDNPGQPYNALNGTGGKTDLDQNTMVDLGVGGAGTIAASFLTDNALLDMELSALENAGYAEIVSQPKVITSDKQAATIKSGTQIPYQEASASGATSTSFKEAVLSLNVTPQITPDNNVIMDLTISKDAVGSATASGVPTININSLTTKVLVPNGETVVLGGIFGVDSAHTDTKVPVLGDLPYLGRLFKRTITSQTKTELLLFITPKIIADKMTN